MSLLLGRVPRWKYNFVDYVFEVIISYLCRINICKVPVTGQEPLNKNKKNSILFFMWGKREIKNFRGRGSEAISIAIAMANISLSVLIVTFIHFH